MTADELATAVGTGAANELASALARIKHCLGQLSDEPGSHAGDHRHDPVAAWGCLQVRLDTDDAGARWPDLRNRAT